MKILVFEWLTGGGVCDLHPLDAETNGLLGEGMAMLSKICHDFTRAGHEVLTPIDYNINVDFKIETNASIEKLKVTTQSELNSHLQRAAELADAMLLIAPESDQCLEQVCQAMQPWREKLISPSLELIQLTSDKWRCHQHLVKSEVPCPATILLPTDELLSQSVLDLTRGPIVIKPVDGAGGEGVVILNDWDSVARWKSSHSNSSFDELLRRSIAQEFIHGLPVSVSVVLQSDGEPHFCEAMEQVFRQSSLGAVSFCGAESSAGETRVGSYFHAREIKNADILQRARKLAVATVGCLPNSNGYLGIDMVVSNQSAGSDCVIEINPRLTSSYVSMSAGVREELIRLMIR